jgi:hypothetical protein
MTRHSDEGRLAQRVRDALTFAADLVDESAAVQRPASPGKGRKTAPHRRYATVAVALATAVVILVAVFGGIRLFGADDSTHISGTGPTHTAAPTHAQTQAPVGLPTQPFYTLAPPLPAADPTVYFAVTGVVPTPSGSATTTDLPPTLTIRDSRNGAVRSTVPAPDGMTWLTVKGTGAPGVFIASAYRTSTDGQLFRIQVNRDGAATSVTPIEAARFDNVIQNYAVDPSGRRLAVDADANREGDIHSADHMHFSVIDLASSKRTEYVGAEGGRTTNLSWDASGRYLAFSVEASYTASGLWLADTAAGTDLTRSAHRIAPYSYVQAGDRSAGIDVPVLSPDGRRLYAISPVMVGQKPVTQLVELDAQTGRRLRVVFEMPFTLPANHIVHRMFSWVAGDPTGDSLVVFDENGGCHLIGLATGKQTTLPSTFGSSITGLAW